ncbi:MAG: Ppx/GppA phosphatase family protein [Pseudomonadota bacterium]|nr:Ppx/GppA phosphatase family protein [Pseudomonadota bacterium]
MANLESRPGFLEKKRKAGAVKTLDSKSAKLLYAALDLGTNSCRMLIARPDGLNFTIVDAFSKSVRLGLDLERTGVLSQAGINRTLQALHVCSRKLRNYGVKRFRLVATEACRRARNGQDFLDKVLSETGLRLEVISPAEEARLAIISCAPLLESNADQVLVVDIGGGSTELVWIDLSSVSPSKRVEAMMKLKPSPERMKNKNQNTSRARIIDWISVPLGVATLHQRYSDVEDDAARFALMSCYFEDQIATFKPYSKHYSEFALKGLQIIGTSGTVTTLGAAHLGLRKYDRLKVDGLNLTAVDVDAVVQKFLKLGPDGRQAEPGIGKDRAELIMSGSAIIQTLLRIWPTQRMRVADRGLREGILYSLMISDDVFNGGNHS